MVRRVETDCGKNKEGGEMKILFVTHRGGDYLASMIWDGAQSLFGEENVYDAVNNPGLHAGGDWNPMSRISGTRQGKILGDEGDFDLMILNACFLRDFDWSLPGKLRERMKPRAKIAYVEGWDSAAEHHEPPTWMRISDCFRREIDPSIRYPFLRVWPLSFAAPERWFDGAESNDRPWDLFFAGAVDGSGDTSPVRWDMLAPMFQTRTKHHSMIATGSIGMDGYFDMLRKSRIGLCPPGAAQSVAMRAFEIVACGAIPFFIGMPQWERDPWFGPDTSFSCQLASGLPDMIAAALRSDLEPMRLACIAHARQHHTTKARVQQMLERMGV
jgi:hypothetical protein